MDYETGVSSSRENEVNFLRNHYFNFYEVVMLSKKKTAPLAYDPRVAKNYQFQTLSSCTQRFSINIYFGRFLLIICRKLVAHKLHQIKEADYQES